jgi:hypothetical protein
VVNGCLGLGMHVSFRFVCTALLGIVNSFMGRPWSVVEGSF